MTYVKRTELRKMVQWPIFSDHMGAKEERHNLFRNTWSELEYSAFWKSRESSKQGGFKLEAESYALNFIIERSL